MTISTAPIEPLSISARTAMKCGSKRRLKPTISVPLLARTTFRQAFTRSSDRSIGFSQNTALPALVNCSIRSAWVSVGVQITTASMSDAAKICAIVRTSQPYWSAMAWAAGAMASATATSLALGLAVTALACTLPIRPAPKSPKRKVIIVPFLQAIAPSALPLTPVI